MRKYEKHHIDYVRSIAKGRYNDEITKMFNSKFNVNKSVSSINSLKKNYGITSGKLPKRVNRSTRLFTKEQEKFIKGNAKGMYNDDLADLINKKYGLQITRRQIATWKKNHNVSSGLNGQFEKGRETWNKGMKGIVFPGSEKGWFSKGRPPENYRPVGSERVCSKDGYVLVKVQDEGIHQERWKHKHIIVWEKHHGKVPHNHVVSFIDSDRTNTNIDNLFLLSRSELVRMNKGNYFSSDPDVTLSGLALVRLDKKILEADLMGNDKESFKKHIKNAAKNGIEEETFKARLKRGWSLHDAINKPLHSRKASKINV